MDRKKLSVIIGLLLCLVALRGMIYSVLIPFNRSPDEEHHFKLVKAKHLQLIGASAQERRQAAAELEVTARYLVYPEMPPGRYTPQLYADAKLPDPPSSLHLYYWTGAKLLQLLSLDAIRDEIYALRGLSILCGVLVVWLSFLVAKDLFPENSLLLIGVPALITFIPQFSAMNGVINNDKFGEVFVSLLFVILVKIFKNGLHWGYVAASLVAISLGILGKRTAAFAILVFLVMLLVYYWRGFPGLRLTLVLCALLIGCAVGGYFILRYNEAAYNFVKENPFGVQIRIPIEEMQAWAFYENLMSGPMLKFYAKFLTLIYWSFWGVFGYMDIHLHHFWYIAAAVVQILAIAGLFLWMFKQRYRALNQEVWKPKVIYLFMASICLLMLVVFLRSIIFRPDDPMLAQGRRLFTAILPIGFLTVFGLQHLFPRKYFRILAASGLLGLLALDFVSLSNYIMLNFHLRAFFK